MGTKTVARKSATTTGNMTSHSLATESATRPAADRQHNQSPCVPGDDAERWWNLA